MWNLLPSLFFVLDIRIVACFFNVLSGVDLL
jgi:hypothetical protein